MKSKILKSDLSSAPMGFLSGIASSHVIIGDNSEMMTTARPEMLYPFYLPSKISGTKLLGG